MVKVWVEEMILRPWILLERVWATDNRPKRNKVNIRWTVVLAIEPLDQSDWPNGLILTDLTV